VQLTSVHHPQLREIRKAANSGRPMPDGTIVAEGPHLLEEARRSSWTVEQIFHTNAAAERFPELLREGEVLATQVAERAFASIASTETTQGILALVRPRSWTWADITSGPRALVVVLDGIQDPGNVGTILRSAEAFGAAGAILAEGSARVSNGKLLRAAAGSLFRVPFLEGVTRREIRSGLKTAGLKMYALAGRGKLMLADCDFRYPCALVAGNEGAGVSEDFVREAEPVRIPTAGVESLNAAVACSIALFEAARRRGTG